PHTAQNSIPAGALFLGWVGIPPTSSTRLCLAYHRSHSFEGVEPWSSNDQCSQQLNKAGKHDVLLYRNIQYLYLLILLTEKHLAVQTKVTRDHLKHPQQLLLFFQCRV